MVGDNEEMHYVGHALDGMRRDPTRTLLRWRDLEISAHEFRTSVLRLAGMLDRLGVDGTVTVAILTTVNSPWMLSVRYAAHLVGAGVVHITGANHGPTTYGLSVETRARMLVESGASVLMTDEECVQDAEKVRDHIAEAEAERGLDVCVLGEPVSGSVLMNGCPVTEVPSSVVPRFPDRAMVLYTSGSTGTPKGICKPFAAWNRSVLGAAADHTQAGTFLVITAVSHTVGLIVDVGIAAGGGAVLREAFEPAEVLRDIGRYQVTDTFMGVPQLYAILDDPGLPTADLSSMNRLVYVGCPALPERVKDAVRILPRVLNQSYGTTETGRIAVLTASDHDRADLLDTVGRPLPNVDVAICHPDSGVELPDGEVGEVVVRSPTTMEGYVADPSLTGRVLREGWVHTGDYGSRDDAGYLRLHGRMNDVMKVQDALVHPTEVEAVLGSHDRVVDVHVYGHRRADLIEELHAAIIFGSGDRPGAVELRELVTQAMTPVHAPVRFVEWDRFPINPNGKVDRPRVRRESVGAAALPDA